MALAACSGEILTGTGTWVSAPAPFPDDGPPVDVTCTPSRVAQTTLDQVAGDFADQMYPSLQAECSSCHGQTSGRLFTLSPSPTQTYYQARALGLFDDQPTSLVWRLTSRDPGARMPKGTSRWPVARIEAMAQIACATRTISSQGPPADEGFPPELLAAYSGPANTDDDNTFIGYRQLRARVQQVFSDSWVRSGVDQFAVNIGLFGGADFTTHFSEARVATGEFLLGLDALAPDVCAAAAKAKKGPFTGFDFTTALSNTNTTNAQIDSLYTRMLFRHATAEDKQTASAMLVDIGGLTSVTDAWQALCEVLVQHPDFLWTLPPSAKTLTGPDRDKLLTVKLANDLLGRPATAAERALVDQGKTMSEIVDQLLASPDFQPWFFHRMRLRTESQGTDVSDEPARLWAYLAVNDRPITELFTAEYGVDPQWQQTSRPAYHGKSGVLTMKGYLSGKPGLPHFNYAARVMSDFMGFIFEIPPAVFAMRPNATAASTVDPTSLCYSCHQNLTPLAYQRQAWDDLGEHRDVDEQGRPIDDTDRGVVPSYEFKGKGLEAFAASAIKKEMFFRRLINSQYQMLFGRAMRHSADERDVYRQLWAVSQNQGTFKALLKAIALSDRYQRSAP